MSQSLEERVNALSKTLTITEELNHIHDLNSLLDKVLYEARQFSHADAGSIFLVKNNRLEFEYVQNDTLFDSVENNKAIYSSRSLPINHYSIAGYVAATGESLVIDDVYDIPSDQPYSFNPQFDKLSNYRTTSVLTVPLKTSESRIVGILQAINAMDTNKQVIPFNEADKISVHYFANSAAVAIERALMNREIVLRMIRMAELRDPKETGAHVNRVGAYSAEIYQKWALDEGMSTQEIQHGKDLTRIGAMTHDVGKIAISDSILKKPGRLDDDEFETMKYHTVYGGQLFAGTNSEVDKIASDIALNHHEKWDGTGYPGRSGEVHADHVKFQPGKEGEEIPLHGRIVALADVYDALISKRVYKTAWEEDDVVKYIKEQSGKHFDPQIVDAFVSIYDVIKAIREKYVD